MAGKEDELQESLERDKLLAAAVSHLDEGVLITNDDLESPAPRIIFVNEAMCRITGYTADELVGQSPRILQGEGTDRQTLDRIRAELSAGRSCLAEVTNYHKNGTPYDAELVITPLFNAEGRRTSYVSIHRDVSGRKQATRALRESRERNQAILETAVDAIIAIDRNGVIETLNAATSRLFGYTQEELVGSNVSILMPSPYREEHDGYIARYLKTGEAQIIGIGREVVGRRKDGSTFPASLAVSQIDHLGMFIGIVRDITDQVESHQRLMLNERLAAIGQTMAGIAHESRNALQRIQASAEMLELDLRDNNNAMAELCRIEDAADQLRELLEEVREYATPIVLDRTRVSVSDIWRQAWQEVVQVHREPVPVFLEETNGIELTCLVDAFRILQVFRNLFENAIAACPDRPHVTVHCADAQIDGVEAIEIAIRDIGPGFAEEHRDKVFDAFFTSKSKGTGLGMAIVKRIVEAHGGRVAIARNRAPGGEVTVTLPRKRSP